MLNNSNSDVIKVFALEPPACRQFRERQFRTLGDFYAKLKEWFGISENEQILLKDGHPVTLLPNAPLEQLRLNTQTALLLIAKQTARVKAKPKKDAETEREVMLGLLHLQQNVRKARERERLRLLNIEISKRLLYSARGKAIDAIVTNFIRRLNIPNSELLLTDRAKLKFILGKIAQGNPYLLKLLNSRIKSVKDALLDISLKRRRLEVQSTVIGSQVSDLTKLGYPQDKVIKALEITKNSPEMAIGLLYNKEVDSPKKWIQPIRKLSPAREYVVMFEWLAGQKAADIILLHNLKQYYWIYLNSLKHTNPQVFKAITHWQAYLPKILSRLYVKIGKAGK